MSTIFTKDEASLIRLDDFMRSALKESRYRHSLGVEKMAVRLADIHGADAEKAAFAGRYHDIAKCLTNDEMNSYVREFGLPVSYLDNNALAHSKVAAGILQRDFGVDDEDVLDAVRSHTTGRAGMSLLEEIIYVADAIEENRQYEGIDELRRQAETDLDGACLFIMDWTIEKIASQGRVADKDTLEARDYIAERIRDKGSGGKMESKETAQLIANLLSDKKARDVIMIDIAEKSSFADYFVIATGGSERQLGSLADEAADKFAEIGIEPKSVDGRPDTGWILIDGGDVIVNLFTAETRDKYTLEKIWSDCESILVSK